MDKLIFLGLFIIGILYLLNGEKYKNKPKPKKKNKKKKEKFTNINKEQTPDKIQVTQPTVVETKKYTNKFIPEKPIEYNISDFNQYNILNMYNQIENKKSSEPVNAYNYYKPKKNYDRHYGKL